MEERFKKPTDEQLVSIAILFHNGALDVNLLTNTVAALSLVVGRLYENGDVTIPTKEESE